MVSLTTEWKTFVASFPSAAATNAIMTPREAYDFWLPYTKAERPGLQVLGKLALHYVLYPTSSASVERLFSILTHMDAPDRRRMKPELLKTTLFLRGNKRVVAELLHAAVEKLPVAEVHRAREEKALSASAHAFGTGNHAIGSGVEASGGGGSGSGAGAKRMRVEEVEEEEEAQLSDLPG